MTAKHPTTHQGILSSVDDTPNTPRFSRATNETCTLNFLQAPKFGNGRTIIDLAKRVFMEVAKRNKGGYCSGGSGKSGDRGDARASAEDIRRATAAVLQQITRVGQARVNTTIDTNAAFSSGSQKAPKAPSTTTRATTVASRGTTQDAHRTAEASGGEHDPFLSMNDLQVLHKACTTAGIDVDSSPISELQDSAALQNALGLSPPQGGAGLSPQDAQTFVRRVAVDRAALNRVVQEAAETEARLASDEAEAKAQLHEAEAELSKEEEEDGDKKLLDKLRLAKRAKELLLQEAREKRERELALERASQAALKRMGVCPAGFPWNRAGGGWRCAGGSHYVSGGAVSNAIAREV